MATYGISGAGKQAEQLFLRLTGAQRSERASAGDAIINGHQVEIKATSTNALNQVRVIKYITLAVYDTRSGSWYVIPAHEQVRAAARQARGQHNEVSFECTQLNLSAFSGFRLAGPSYDLRNSVIEAIRESEQFPDVRLEMQVLLAKLQNLAQQARERTLHAFEEWNH